MKGVKTLDSRILNLLRQSAAADRSNHDISGNFLKKESRQIKFSSWNSELVKSYIRALSNTGEQIPCFNSTCSGREHIVFAS
jgi:hypothetical protein